MVLHARRALQAEPASDLADARRTTAAVTPALNEPQHPDLCSCQTSHRNRLVPRPHLPTAAAESGLAPNEFAERLRRSPELSRALGALLARGGTVQRQVFQESYLDLVKVLYPEQPGSPPVTGRQAQYGHTAGTLMITPGTLMQFQLLQPVTL